MGGNSLLEGNNTLVCEQNTVAIAFYFSVLEDPCVPNQLFTASHHSCQVIHVCG